MTAGIRNVVRRNRRRGVAAALAVATTAALIAVVVPASAQAPEIPPPSGADVMPTVANTGGQDNDCQFVGSNAQYSYRFQTPQTGTFETSVGGSPVTFTLRLYKVSGEQFLDYTIDGAVALDVVVKGGSDSAHYDNEASQAGPLAADTKLHATRSTTGSKKLYDVSHTTFCLSRLGTISGTVYEDANESQAKNTFEPGLEGWTVTLYAAGEAVATDLTDANGGYSFPGQTLGTEYTVCVTAPEGTWAQTTPTGNSYCAASPQPEPGPAGHRFTLASPTQTADFGNIRTFFKTCGVKTEIPGKIEVYFSCTTDPENPPEFVISAWTEIVDGVPLERRNVHPLSQQTGQVPVVVKAYFSFEGTAQNPLTQYYDDLPPYDGQNAKVLQQCTSDPIKPGTDFDLVDPSADPRPADETSCLARKLTISGGSEIIWVFTKEDGWIGPL